MELGPCGSDGGFFLFKLKTAYEMRISDWSSDVCFPIFSALIDQVRGRRRWRIVVVVIAHIEAGVATGQARFHFAHFALGNVQKIGRASSMERVCQYV